MLGFTGTALYAAGILFGIGSMIAAKSTALLGSLGQQEGAFRVVALVCIAEVISGNPFINVGGAILWIFLGLWMSARAKIEADYKLQTCSNDSLLHLTSTICGEVLT
jgi:ATP/ADP translocase